MTISTFDRASIETLTDTVGQVRKRNRSIRATWDTESHRDPTRFRIAKTTTDSDFPSYPSSGDTFVVELGSMSFTAATGIQANTWAAYSPKETRLAHDITGKYWAQGEYVNIALHNERWFIIGAAAPSSLPRAFFYTSTTYAITTQGIIHVIPFNEAQSPNGIAPEVTYSAGPKEWTVNGTSKWMHHLTGLVSTSSAIPANAYIQIRMYVSWNINIPATPGGWTVASQPALWAFNQYYPTLTISDSREFTQISSQAQEAGRRFRVCAVATVYPSSTPINLNIGARLTWSEVKAHAPNVDPG